MMENNFHTPDAVPVGQLTSVKEWQVVEMLFLKTNDVEVL